MATTNKLYLDKVGLSTLVDNIKKSLNIKSGDVYYDIETQYIYFFKDISDRVKWCINKDINSDLIIHKQKIIPEFKTILNNTSISIEGYTGNTIATLPSATQSSAGLLTANDKLKLDNVYNSLKDKQEKMNINIINSADTASNIEYEINKNSILKIVDNVTGVLTINFETPSMDDYDKLIQYGLV
jgi:hypothetical protein